MLRGELAQPNRQLPRGADARGFYGVRRQFDARPGALALDPLALLRDPGASRFDPQRGIVTRTVPSVFTRTT